MPSSLPVEILTIPCIYGMVYFVFAAQNSDKNISEAKYLDRVLSILDKMPQWREERLPPPRVSQSEVRFHLISRPVFLFYFAVR